MTQPELFNLNALAEAKQTMKAKFTAMVQYFIEDSESYIATIKEAMAANSVEAIIAPAHTLKSSSKQMGAERLSLIAREIESMAREQASSGNGDAPAFHSLVSDLEKAFLDTKSGLPTYAC